MPTPAIIRGSDQFFVTNYYGNGGGQKVGKFQPFTDSGTIAKSCTFNSPDSARLSRTPSGTGTSKKTFTISVWMKRGRNINYDSSHTQSIYSVYHGNNSRYSVFGLYNGGSGNPNHFRFFLGKYTTGSSTSGYDWYTNRTLEDNAKWYHLMGVVDTTDSTADDRVKMYIDGERITSFASSSNPSLNDEFYFGSERTNYISIFDGSNHEFDGYLAEFNFVDGTALTPDTFGLTDTSTGRWIPKTLTGITYGTNGTRLEFANNAGQTIGDDTSGNTNDFTVTNLAATDITPDSPTQNYPVFDYSMSSSVLYEGNRQALGSGNGTRQAYTTMTIDPSDQTGYYIEFKLVQATYSNFGFMRDDIFNGNQIYISEGMVAMNYVDDLYQDGTNVYAGSDTFSNDDIIGFYVRDSKLYYSINGTMQNSSNPIGTFKPGRYRITVGHQANYSPRGHVEIICPSSKWNYTPSGSFADYREIQQDNLPELTPGKPDWVWIKNRDAADSHQWYDSSRGLPIKLSSDLNSAESTINDGVQKFLKGGVDIEDDVSINTSGEDYIAWNWLANGGTETANTDGSGSAIACTIQANPTAGFSIVKWEGDNGQTQVAHGLSQAPEVSIQKKRNGSGNWWVYSTVGPNAYNYNNLNTYNTWSNYTETAPSAKTFTSHGWTTGQDVIAYNFHSVPGFSKIGKYIGNANADGPFIYLGFKPRWFLHKANNGASWYLYDTVRSPHNPALLPLFPNTTGTESSNVYGFDFLSNGIKVRQPTGYGANYSSVLVWYMAFAEHPFIGDGVSPATAR